LNRERFSFVVLQLFVWLFTVFTESTFGPFQGQFQNRINETEARIFWTALILTPLLWAIFFFLALFGLRLRWMLLVIIALMLNGANLYGYFKCKVGSKESISSVTADFFRKQVLQNAVSLVTRETTPQANPMSQPVNTV
jgi:hypothetical protein